MINRIGKYDIEEEIGRGGFGRVYRATDSVIGRPVAIKVLYAQTDSSLLSRFRREAATTGKLRHRNIVTLYDFGEHDALPYLVMEHVEGRTLSAILKSGEKLSLLERLDIVHQAAQALRAAHESGIIHRDVKPGNIMVQTDGTVKMMDFGIARVTDNASTFRTEPGLMIGTAVYMAPEQLRDAAEADFLTDIFAFGEVSYELLASRHPFAASDPTQMMYKAVHEEPPLLRTVLPGCPEPLSLLIHQALAKDRKLRCRSMADFIVDLEPVLLDLRQDHAAVLIQEAARARTAGDATAALAKVRQALELDPGNRQARELRDLITRGVPVTAPLDEQKSAQLESVRERVSAVIDAADFEEARRLLRIAAERFGTEPLWLEAAELLNRQLRDRQISQLKDQVAGHLARNEITAAREELEVTRVDYANSPEWQKLFALLNSREEERAEAPALAAAAGAEVVPAAEAVLTPAVPSAPPEPDVRSKRRSRFARFVWGFAMMCTAAGLVGLVMYLASRYTPPRTAEVAAAPAEAPPKPAPPTGTIKPAKPKPRTSGTITWKGVLPPGEQRVVELQPGLPGTPISLEAIRAPSVVITEQPSGINGWSGFTLRNDGGETVESVRLRWRALPSSGQTEDLP